MTQYHGSGRATLENAVSRAIRRQEKIKEIKRWAALEAEHINNPVQYRAAIAERRALGLPFPKRKTMKERVIALNSGRSRAAVTMPGDIGKGVDARTAAEDRAISAIEGVLEKLQYHLEELAHTPNPNSRYVNRINQRLLMDAIERIKKLVPTL